MPGAPDLQAQARSFASDVSHLLNNTVTTGIRVSAVLLAGTGDCWVGRNITRKKITPDPIPLTINQKPPRAYLFVGHVLQLDPEGIHLMNTQATFGLYLDEGFERMLLHYDYLRDSPNQFPEAHLQISGQSAAFEELCQRAGKGQSLERLHLPVGGRRFRPSLEDLVEFLVVEEFVDRHDDWKDAVEFHRGKFHRIQLMAAVRRDPDAAREALEELAED